MSRRHIFQRQSFSFTRHHSKTIAALMHNEITLYLNYLGANISTKFQSTLKASLPSTAASLARKLKIDFIKKKYLEMNFSELEWSRLFVISCLICYAWILLINVRTLVYCRIFETWANLWANEKSRWNFPDIFPGKFPIYPKKLWQTRNSLRLIRNSIEIFTWDRQIDNENISEKFEQKNMFS